MDILNIRRQLRTKSIYEIPLRVVYYARVSTEKDEQLNSLENQKNHYDDYILKNDNWEFAGSYIDEGISGISTIKRENFHRMIEDAQNGKFDFIVTKEFSRFARNTLDSIEFTRKLLSNGVAVLFQNDNINTLDEDSELRLTIMAAIAQDEVRKLSSRIKFGHQQSIKNGVVLGNSRIFGYKKDGKRLIIDDNQSDMVKELFEMYATNEYSMKQIEDIFWEKGYRNYNNKKIAHTTMSNIISNPKYKGYYVGNKVKIVDMFTKKQKFLPENEWVIYKDETGDIVPAIVTEDLWDSANNVLKARSDAVKNRKGKCNHNNLLTGKLFCSNCGLPYYRRDSVKKDGTKLSNWVCSGKTKNGKDTCPSIAIYENEVKEMLFDLLFSISANIDEIIKKYIDLLTSVKGNDNLNEKLNSLIEKINLIGQKKSKLLEYNISGKISDTDFLKMNDTCQKELEAYENEIENINKTKLTEQETSEYIKTVRKTLAEACKNAKEGVIDALFIQKFIDKITVSPCEDNFNNKDKVVNFEIYLKQNEQRFKYEFNKSRTGHIFKKMIEQYAEK